ncbi:MAG: sulfite reductase [Chlamydiae bacterium]|nr:sulfite reductase [Chlamydiota bacterium]
MSTIIYTTARKNKEETVFNKNHPFIAHLKSRQRLNKRGSSKQTFHIVLDIKGFQDVYKEGDAVAILPQNPKSLLSKLLSLLHATGHEEVKDPKTQTPSSLLSFLQYKTNLSRITPQLLTFLQPFCEKPFDHLLAHDNKQARLDFIQAHDLITCLQELNPTSKIPPQDFITTLAPMLPRFYSIASSPSLYQDELHLLVATFSYPVQEELRAGVGSDFLCHGAEPCTTAIPLYIQPNPNFFLPDDPAIPLIMIGAGTGLAPYRAFLQKRFLDAPTSRQWLFFGERHRAFDFYYEEEILNYCQKNFLQLTTAFSRDQAEKCYVQHQLHAHACELWKWLQEGAILYVCGDAKHMAKDVHDTLTLIAQKEGLLSLKEAQNFLQKLRKEKRYQTDVY